jgi:hypothetical protein
MRRQTRKPQLSWTIPSLARLNAPQPDTISHGIDQMLFRSASAPLITTTPGRARTGSCRQHTCRWQVAMFRSEILLSVGRQLPCRFTLDPPPPRQEIEKRHWFRWQIVGVTPSLSARRGSSPFAELACRVRDWRDAVTVQAAHSCPCKGTVTLVVSCMAGRVT